MERVYDRSVEVWDLLRQCLAEGLELGVVNDPFKKPDAPVRRGTPNGVLWRYFWGAHQRFFKDLCVASKVPAALQVARQSLKDKKCVVIGLQSTGEARTKDAIEEHGEVFDDFVSAPRATLERLIKKVFASPGDDEADARQRELKQCASRDDAPLGRTHGRSTRTRKGPAKGTYAQSDTDFSDSDADSDDDEKAAAKLGVTLGKTLVRHKTASGEMREGVVVRRAFPFFVVQFGSEEAKFTAAQLHGILVFDVDDDSASIECKPRKRPVPSSDEESSDDDFVESDSDNDSEAPQKSSKTKKTKYISIDSSGDEDEDAMQDDEDDGTRAASLRDDPRHRRDARARAQASTRSASSAGDSSSRRRS